MNKSKDSCQNCNNTECLIHQNFKDFPESEIVANKNIIKCKKGQQFIMEGAPVNGFFIILQGIAKVFRTGINGREQIVRFAKAGEIVGNRGLSPEECYPIGAVALSDCKLCYFPKSILKKTLLSNPRFSYDMMLFFASELNKSEIRVKSISQMSVRERIIDTLLYIQRKFGTLNGYLSLSLSRKEYAQYAGTTEEQVIRTLSQLKKEKFIETATKRIKINDFKKLRAEIKDHNYFIGS